jgi:hypothetical protein
MIRAGVPMPARKDAIEDRLGRYREIKITVTGRKSGRAVSFPIWFVFEQPTLYLLPVRGSDTQWYKNALERPSIAIDARGAAAEFTVAPVTDPAMVKSIVEKFRAKYGDEGVGLYSKLDVAVVALPR